MQTYPFEYFCGANVTIRVDGFPILECAGLSYSIAETKRPIYAYHSRLYDAVARGQVLVQGSILVNYVHQDYLFKATELAKSRSLQDPVLPQDLAIRSLRSVNPLGTKVDPTIENYIDYIENQKAAYWNTSISPSSNSKYNNTYNLHDGGNGYTIEIIFGEQSNVYPNGQTALIIHGVAFTGRGTAIQIDSETIVEQYSFLGRNVASLRTPYVPVEVVPVPSDIRVEEDSTKFDRGMSAYLKREADKEEAKKQDIP